MVSVIGQKQSKLSIQFTIIRMNRRIVYKEEAKCNFCYNWFQVFSEVKFGLNICESCIYKALNSSCFKFPTPQGNLYQVYLAPCSISFNQNSQSLLLQKMDEYLHTQVRDLLQKWETITKVLKAVGSSEEDEQILRQIDLLLKNDSLTFHNGSNKSINQIRSLITSMRDKSQKREKSLKIPRTPIKEKTANFSIKLIDKSNTKSINRKDSKKSLKSHRQLSRYDKNDGQNDKQNNEDDVKRQQVGSFYLGQPKRNVAVKTLNLNENKEFLTKMQLIKNNISASLEERQEMAMHEPINILKERIYEAIQNTNCINKCIQMVSYNKLQGIDMRCYLNNLQWQGVQVVKFVKVGLTDEQLQVILQFIKGKSVQTLVLTSNNLTQESCRTLLATEVQSLHNIYLGKNQVFALKAKAEIRELKSKYNFFL